METMQTHAQESRITLDSLALLDAASLDRLYRTAVVPDSMRDINGNPEGRMLAVRRLDSGAAATAIRRFAASSIFPWGGKSFEAKGAEEGSGINRVRLGMNFRLFPFTTRFGPSVIDGRPALILDYDQPGNPFFIRKIHDEVRETAPGIFFGPACWKTDNTPVTVLWFALDCNTR